MRYFVFISLPLYIIDQLTKLSVLKSFPDPWMTPPGQWRVITVIPGFFDIVRVHNEGMAFGILNDWEYANELFCVVATVAVVVVTVLWRRGAFPTLMTRLAAALLISGILGNATDRLLHHYVVDFLSFDLWFMIWPSFNIADACISVAATLLVITAFSQPKSSPDAET